MCSRKYNPKPYDLLPSVLWILVCGAIVVATVSSCSPQGESSAERIHLSILTHWGAGFQDRLISYIAEYEQLNPDIRITYQSVPYPDYLRSVIISHLSGNSPDIYHLYSLWGAQLANNNILAIPPDTISSFVQEEYTPSAVESITYNGILFGIPTEISTLALFYRNDYFNEAGLYEPPATWDELFAYSKKLTRYSADGKIMRAGFAFPREWDTGMVLPFYSILWSQSGMLIPQVEHNARETADKIEMTLSYMKRFYDEQICDASFTYSTFPRDLFNGRVAMALLTPDWKGQLEAGMDEEFRHVRIAPIPEGTVQQVSAGYAWFYAVDASSAHKGEAWRFLRWLNDRETGSSRMGNFLSGLGMLPSRYRDLTDAKHIFNDPFILPFYESLAFTRPEPIIPSSRKLKTMLMREIEYACLGIHSPGEAARRIISKIDRLTDE
jgi:multiple sugar transport system substrate-binding protein